MQQNASSPAGGPETGGERAPRRQFVKYDFYKVAPEWRRLPAEERAAQKDELVEVVGCYAQRMMVRSYSLVGLRGDCDFLLWKVSPRLELLQEFATALASTRLGAYLSNPYAYLAMTRRSTYVDKHHHPGQEGRRLTVEPGGARYLFVYPFVKTRAWYRLPLAERQRMMNQHFEIGHRFPSVKINTSYSFGLDDQEFMLGFETPEPGDFLELVMTLRESEASSYTLRDTPIFTCLAMAIEDVMASLGE